MNKEEIDEIDKLEIDFNDLDELNLALEVSSKKAIYLLDELCENIIKLQQENKQLKEELDTYKKLIDYIKKLNLYEYDLDYDYEENPVDNYYPADMEYHIENWLECEKIEKGDRNE